MFQSETYGKLEIEQIPEKLFEFYEKNKKYETDFQVIVGTDSQNFSDTKIVNVIAIICDGHGGIYFYNIDHIRKINNVREKLYVETDQSLVLMDNILRLIEDEDKYSELYEKCMFTIHVDAGHSEYGKTKELIPAIVGWIKSQGYECSVKPDSFVASTIANRISK